MQPVVNKMHANSKFHDISAIAHLLLDMDMDMDMGMDKKVAFNKFLHLLAITSVPAICCHRNAYRRTGNTI